MIQGFQASLSYKSLHDRVFVDDKHDEYYDQ